MASLLYVFISYKKRLFNTVEIVGGGEELYCITDVTELTVFINK